MFHTNSRALVSALHGRWRLSVKLVKDDVVAEERLAVGIGYPHRRLEGRGELPASPGYDGGIPDTVAWLRPTNDEDRYYVYDITL